MSKKKVDIEELRALGFSEDVIEEAVLRDDRGLLDVEFPPDLAERTLAVCRGKREELRKGDVINIMVTGTAVIFEATVVGFDSCKPTPHPRLKVNKEKWDSFTLKCGDYILVQKKQEK